MVFHGAKDKIVSVKGSTHLYKRLARARRGPQTIRLTIFREMSHACWSRAYRAKGLLEWIAPERQRRRLHIVRKHIEKKKHTFQRDFSNAPHPPKCQSRAVLDLSLCQHVLSPNKVSLWVYLHTEILVMCLAHASHAALVKRT